MADHLNVVPAELRHAAGQHREHAEALRRAGSDNSGILASLDSLGPIFADLRDAGHELLDERRACYERQAAAYADLADKLIAAADTWEQSDAEAAARLRALGEDPP